MRDELPPEVELSVWLDCIALVEADLRGGTAESPILDLITELEYLRLVTSYMASMFGAHLETEHDPLAYLARYREHVIVDYQVGMS
jgi:hypothetical protein